MKVQEKQAIVEQLAERLRDAEAVYLTDFTGLNVKSMTDLRARLRRVGGEYLVVKNTLARRAVEGTEFECLKDAFVGPLILAFSLEDPGAAARVFKDFAKENKTFEVKFLGVGGKMLPPSELDRLASMPTREQALSMLMATMKAPVQKLVSTLNEVPSKLARTLAAIRDAKERAA